MNYDQFIQNIIDTRGQWSIPAEEYHEKHHIIARCLGGLPKYVGKNCKHHNIIWLTAEEHFIAHKLLVEKYPENKSIHTAFWFMCNTRDGQSILNADEYAELRQQRSANMTGANNPFYGKKHSEETKSILAQKSHLNGLGRLGTNNKKIICLNTNMEYSSIRAAAKEFGTTSSSIWDSLNKNIRAAGYYWAYAEDPELETKIFRYYGLPQSFEITEETRSKLSESSKGRRWTDEAKQKVSKANTGKKRTEEVKQRISKTKTGVKLSDEHKQKIAQGMLGKPGTNNVKIKCIELDIIFESIVETAIQLNISRSSIYKVLDKADKTTKGFHFITIKEES